MRIHSDLFESSQLPHTIEALWQTILLAESMNRQASLKDAVHGAEIVTQADAACENKLLELLELNREADPITIGEESTPGERTFPLRFRTHDPIDGTNAYAFGTKRWGTLFAEFENRLPVCGVALLADTKSGFSIVRRREEVLLWDLATGSSKKLEKPCPPEGALLYFPGYMPDEMAERIKHRVSSLGITLKPSACAVEASVMLAQGEACALYAHNAKIWDFAPSAALVSLWGGSSINLDSLAPAGWDQVRMNAIVGFDSQLTTQLAQKLSDVNQGLLPPDKQWVPLNGSRVMLRDVAR